MSTENRRGRGRPRRTETTVSEPAIIVDGTDIPTSADEANGDGDNSVIDLNSVGVGSDDTGSSGGSVGRRDGGKRRGRPKGSGAGKKASGTVSVSGIEQLLYSGHMLLATITKTEELALDRAEATLLAGGLAEVAKQYDFMSRVLSDKSAAWLAFGQAVAAVYGPRAFVLMAKKKAAKKDELPSTVTPFPGMAGTA